MSVQSFPYLKNRKILKLSQGSVVNNVIPLANDVMVTYTSSVRCDIVVMKMKVT